MPLAENQWVLTLGVNCDLKNSLKDELRKGIESKGFPSEISVRVKEYWEESGNYIRDLRDVSEHFMDLSGDAMIEWSNDPGLLLVFLPDNPETKSPAQFTYAKEIDAFETLAQSAQGLSVIVDLAAKLGGYEKKPSQQVVSFGRNGILAGRTERTISLMVSVKSRAVDLEGNQNLVLDAIEFGQKSAGESENAEMWVRKPKTDAEEGLI